MFAMSVKDALIDPNIAVRNYKPKELKKISAPKVGQYKQEVHNDPGYLDIIKRPSEH